MVGWGGVGSGAALINMWIYLPFILAITVAELQSVSTSSLPSLEYSILYPYLETPDTSPLETVSPHSPASFRPAKVKKHRWWRKKKKRASWGNPTPFPPDTLPSLPHLPPLYRVWLVQAKKAVGLRDLNI